MFTWSSQTKVTFGRVWDELHHAFESNKTLVATTVSSVRWQIDNWEHNRTIDDARLGELTEYMEAAGSVPGVIYVFTREARLPLASPQTHLLCFDGGHRLKAALELYSQHGVDLPMVLAVLRATDDAPVWAEFEALNKRIQVPKHMLRAVESLRLRAVVAELARRMAEGAWKDHFVNTAAPMPPNVNRDYLATRVRGLLEEEGLEGLGLKGADETAQVERLLGAIVEINDDLRAAAGDRAHFKCAKTGCYLFAVGEQGATHEEFLRRLRAALR